MGRDESYEIAPARLGRSSPRRGLGAVVVVAVFLGLAIIKPWGGTSGPDPWPSSPVSVRAEATSSTPAPSLAAVARRVATPPEAEPSWPIDLNHTTANDPSALVAQEAIKSLTIHSGLWGVGDAGVGPRLLRDEPWSDWAAVAPEPSSEPPDRIVKWPGTSLCDGYPTINDKPLVVAVTAPVDTVPNFRMVGWWTDGGRVASLAGSVRQAVPSGASGIRYLERVDQRPWPAGRYEFHVFAGNEIIALTVCISRLS